MPEQHNNFIPLAAALMLQVAAAGVSAATVYVSPAGTAGGDGSEQAPVRTPQRALELAAEGDTIIFRQGSYIVNSPLRVERMGVTLTTITGERAVLAGSSTDPDKLPAVLDISGDGVVVADLSVRGGFYGIKIDRPGDAVRRVRIRSVRVGDTGADCFKCTNADGLVIEGCDIGPSGLAQKENAEGIDVVGSLGVTIRNCVVHDTATNGIYLKGGTRNGVIEGCTVRNTGHGGILLGQDTDVEFMRRGVKNEAIDCVAKNNLITNTATAGLGTYAGMNVRFENNTVVNAAGAGQAALWVVTNSRDVPSERVTFSQNIILKKGPRPLVFIKDPGDMPKFDKNLYFNTDVPGIFRREFTALDRSEDMDFAKWQRAMEDKHSVQADPMLDAGRDYLPREGSPAIGLGRQPATRPATAPSAKAASR